MAISGLGQQWHLLQGLEIIQQRPWGIFDCRIVMHVVYLITVYFERNLS